jgi:hypothetical protein
MLAIYFARICLQIYKASIKWWRQSGISMNRLNLDRRTQIVSALVEGNSIRSTERMTGVHRDTIMRLLVEVDTGCAALMDEKMRELPCQARTG